MIEDKYIQELKGVEIEHSLSDKIAFEIYLHIQCEFLSEYIGYDELYRISLDPVVYMKDEREKLKRQVFTKLS